MLKPRRPEFRISVEDESNLLYSYKKGPQRAKINLDRLTRQTIEVLTRWFADGSIRQRDEVKLIGSYLYRVLFGDKIQEEFLEALKTDGDPANPLRVVLSFGNKARELATWPWEYLYLPDDLNRGTAGTFLASDTKLTLSRNVPKMAEDKASSDDEELRILVVISEPDNANAVDTDEVLSKLTEFAKEAPDKIKLKTLPEICPDCMGESRSFARSCDTCDGNGISGVPTFRQFDKAMKWRPHIVHFIGHGKFENKVGSLGFIDEGEQNLVDWTEETDVADSFNDWKPHLVFLQACKGAHADTTDVLSGVALRLAYNGIPAVIAMQFKTGNQVAQSFATKFYDTVRERPIDEAVQHGRVEIRRFLSFGDIAFGCPVVYLHNFADVPEQRFLPFPETKRKATGHLEHGWERSKTRSPSTTPVEHSQERSPAGSFGGYLDTRISMQGSYQFTSFPPARATSQSSINPREPSKNKDVETARSSAERAPTDRIEHQQTGNSMAGLHQAAKPVQPSSPASTQLPSEPWRRQ